MAFFNGAGIERLYSGVTKITPFEAAISDLSRATDAAGGDMYNLRLSEMRALSVKAYLVRRHGLDPGRFVEAGYGETRLLDGGVGRPISTTFQHCLGEITQFIVVQAADVAQFQ